MPAYMYQVAYSASGAKALVTHPQSREEIVRKSIEAAGGKIHSFFFAFGPYDVILIVEFPDNVSAAAFAMSVAASGAVSKFATTVLMTDAEAMDMMKKAQKSTYTAPA